MASLTNTNKAAPHQKAIDDLNEPSENERRLAQVIEFILRYRIVTQAVITFAAIVSGYALASFIRDGGARRLALDLVDGWRSRRGDREAEGRMAGRFMNDFLEALGISRD